MKEQAPSIDVYCDDDEYIDSSELSDEIFRSIEVFSSDDEDFIAFEDPIEARNADTLLDETASKFNKESSAENIETRRSFKSKVSKA